MIFDECNMALIEFSQDELDTLTAALITMETRMLEDADKYKANGNEEAKMDCIEQWRAAKNLRERIYEARYK